MILVTVTINNHEHKTYREPLRCVMLLRLVISITPVHVG